MDTKIIGSLLPTEADLAFSWNTGRRSCTWVLVHGIGLVCTSKCSTYISHTYSTNHNIMVATQNQQKNLATRVSYLLNVSQLLYHRRPSFSGFHHYTLHIALNLAAL